MKDLLDVRVAQRALFQNPLTDLIKFGLDQPLASVALVQGHQRVAMV